MSIVNKLFEAAGLTPTLSTDHTISSRVLRIGPAEAAALMQANTDNRALRRGRVAYYAKVMKEGGWRLTHQGIAFSTDGRGMDLQHRLSAIIMTGMTVDLVVTEGLDPIAFEAIDQHERRSTADALGISRNHSEEAKFLLLTRGGKAAQNPTVLEVGEAACLIESLHKDLIEVCNTRKFIVSTVPMRVAAMTLMHERPALAPQILQNYRNLVLTRSEVWTPVMHAFNRKLNNKDFGTTGPERFALLAAGLAVLDPKKSDNKTIKCDNPVAIENAKARAASLLSTMDIGDEEQDGITSTEKTRANRRGTDQRQNHAA